MNNKLIEVSIIEDDVIKKYEYLNLNSISYIEVYENNITNRFLESKITLINNKVITIRDEKIYKKIIKNINKKENNIYV